MTATYLNTSVNDDDFRDQQWYLDGYLTPGGNVYGANVDAASVDYTGAGVRIAVQDEGFDIDHVELSGQFDMTDSYDIDDNDNSIDADTGDNHGTFVTGIMAAKNNSDGIVGVSSGAEYIGLYNRFGSGGATRQESGTLFDHALSADADVLNLSWGYQTAFTPNANDSVSWGPDFFDKLAALAEDGRGGSGTTVVVAAGNDRAYIANDLDHDGGNTNYSSLTNSRYVTTVGSIDSDGAFSDFSTPGASILVTAPGSDIYTTRPGDDYSSGLSGTSFSAPIVSGVVALMLEANPDLGYRDVQNILALSSRKNDFAGSDWAENAATNWNGGGNFASHDYGFGLVDAHAAVRLAESWDTTTPKTWANQYVLTHNDVDAGGTAALTQNVENEYTFNVSGESDFRVDWVEVQVTLNDVRCGDIEVRLESPDGLVSVLMDNPAAGTDMRYGLSNWTFTTNHDWGEVPNGDWTVHVIDNGSLLTGGTVDDIDVRIYGDDGVGSNDTFYFTDDFSVVADSGRQTITDTSGTDTINLSMVTSNTTLYMYYGAASTVDGTTLNFASGTTIENAWLGIGDDVVTGNSSANIIHGGKGDDILDGGAGNDTLYGGEDDDMYAVDGAGDTVVELANEGTDTVNAYYSGYTLGSNIENGNIGLTTGATMTGNSLANVISGHNGADTIYGEGGDDLVYGASGNDTVYGGDGNDNVVGNGGADTLYGGAGNDQMDGSNDTDADTLYGGTGDDYYAAFTAADTIVEYANEGTDTVNAYYDNYVLGSNLENANLVYANMSLFGNSVANVLGGTTGADSLYGGGGNDTLYGGAGADVLDGQGGADTMNGSTGNDTYVVDDAGDTITDNGGDSGDAVVSLLSSYTMASNIETGYIGLTTGATLVGNSAANTLSGHSGADTIDGGAGADSLWGAGGDDIFRFAAGQGNGDTINDFSQGHDTLNFSGYSSGSRSFAQVNSTTITIADATHSDTITFASAVTLTGSDWLWV